MKVTKKALAWLLSAAMAFGMLFGSFAFTAVPTVAASATWEGSADTSWYNDTDTAFTITTAEQLAGFASLVNSGNTFKGKTVSLGDDITLSKTIEWIPIGHRITEGGAGSAGSSSVITDYYFEGIFDGRGHYVRDIFIDNLSGSADDCERNALFGHNKGIVRNVGVTGTVKSYRDGASVVAYNCPEGIVEFCYGGAAITANGGGGQRGSGGVVGENYGLVQYCWSDSDVYNGYRCAGGIVGNNAESDDSTSGTVSHCWFVGYADSAANETKGSIAGSRADGSIITECYYLKNSSGAYVNSNSAYNGKSVPVGTYGTSFDISGTYEFDSTGALTSDSTKTVTQALTADNNAVVAGSSYYPVLYWQADGFNYETSVANTNVNITVNQTEGGTITASVSGSVKWGTTVTLSYSVEEGYKFAGYYVNGTRISGNKAAVFADSVITAEFGKMVGQQITFQQDDYELSVVDADGNVYENGDLIPEGTAITISASLKDGAEPSDTNMMYVPEFAFYKQAASDEEPVLMYNNYTDGVISFTMPGEPVTLSAVIYERTRDWSIYADTSWYNADQDTFTLTTAAQLAGLAELVATTDSFEGKTILLGNDIDLTGPEGEQLNWTPIGAYYSSRVVKANLSYANLYTYKLDGVTASNFNTFKTKYQNIFTKNANGSYSSATTFTEGYEYYVRAMFWGTFDGQGHRISNMYIDAGFANLFHSGLFALTKDATIKNFTIDGNIITARSGESYGSAVALAYRGTVVENVTNFVEYSGYIPEGFTATSSGSGIGGVIGAISNAYSTENANVTIKNCVNYADFAFNINTSGIGGIIGKGAPVVIEDCMNYGNITGYQNLGGIIGTINAAGTSSVVRSGNEGNITATIATGTQTTSANVGGVVGSLTSASAVVTINECYNTGNVDGATGHSVGGIIGQSGGKATITNVYNRGNVHSTFFGNDAGTTNNGFGGIAGQAKAGTNISNAYTTGTVAVERVGTSTRAIRFGPFYGASFGSIAVKISGTYLEGVGVDQSYNGNSKADVSGVVSATEEYMKSADFVTSLGDSFKAAATINDLYPILSWQKDATLSSVNVTDAVGGTIRVNATRGVAGDTITVQAEPDIAYTLKSVGYTVGDSAEVIELQAAEGVYSFVLPEADVTVVAEFEADPTVVVNVFGVDLTMADLLAYAQTKNITDISGNVTKCAGAALADIIANYAPIPEGLETIVVSSGSGDDVYRKIISVEDVDKVILAWREGSISTLDQYKVRFIIDGTAKGMWVNAVDSINACTHEFGNDHICTICGEEETEILTIVNGETSKKVYAGDFAALEGEESTKSYSSKNGATEVTAKFVLISAVAEAAGIDLPEGYCGFKVTAGDGFSGNLGAAVGYLFRTEDGSIRSAVDGSAGRLWVSGVETVEVIAEHTAVTDIAVAATCTETGLTEGSHCSVCGEVIVAQEVVPALGHNFGEDHKCTVCGEEETEILTIVNGETSKKVYAGDFTALEGEESTKSYSSRNGATEVTAKFVLISAVAEAAGIELPEGYCGFKVTAGDGFSGNLGATVGYLFKTEEGSIRSAVDGSAGRLWVSGVETVEVIAEHTVVTDEAVAATCTETGLTEGSHCSVCGEVLVAQEVVPALGHTEVTDAAVAATCTETGLTEGSHCSVCGEVLVAQEVVPALGHTAVTDAAVAATCTETGLTEGSHCSVCGEVLVAQEVVPALGHTVVTDAAVAATCTETGLTEGSHCSVCGEVLVAQEEVPALGHSWDEGKVTKPATTEDAGEITYTCTVCGETRVEAIEKIVAVTGITIDPIETELATTSSLQIATTVAPENATNKNIIWRSSDETVATVDENGVVTALTYGKAVVTATTEDGNFSATCEIQTRFYDVLESNVTSGVYKTVYWGADNKLVSGYDGGVYFGPERSVTRAEMAVFLYRLAGRPSVTINESAFPDVTAGTVSAGALKAISWALEAGIAKGYDDGTFRPEGLCTRAEMAVFLYRLAGRPAVSANAKETFSDMDGVSSGALKAISWAVESGITKGYDDGTFKPADSCSRANTVIFMYRFDKLDK